MFRTSLRLQEMGYYHPDGSRSISYKERLYRVFGYRGHRRRSRSRSHGADDADDYVPLWKKSFPLDRMIPSSHPVLISLLLFLVFLGLLHTFLKLRTLHQEVQTLHYRVNEQVPLADVMSNFTTGLSGFTRMFMEVKMLRQEVQMLQQQMNTYAPLADMVPNFASEWLGAKIIHGSSSETYQPTENSGILSGITSFLFSSNLRRVVIQEQTPLHPGNCWCFSGGEGHLVVSLAQPAAVSHVTLGHISKSQSPTGNTSSAPRKFSVYGLWNTRDPGVYLGTVTYNIDGPSFQTSRLGNPSEDSFCYVKLQVHNNWGNKDYTCIYSFKIHGSTST
ncbi:uncharacterized protein LOC142890242 [Nelusetta ayraudi]|uniref:uncharacterized protein LOC142890242 n=1 Tax=Nelusetta ayraudi TaxID=303726 RepID=UPI003F709A03